MAPEPSVVSAMIGRNPAMIVSYAGGMRRVLGNPRAYTILAPVLTVLGAATTIIVPSFLGPAQFIAFSLAMAVFQYVYDFDLGLSRLVDREFSQPNASAERAHDITMSARPIREATITVAGSIALLLVLMWVGNHFASIIGESWGCALSAFSLLIVMIRHLHHHQMIKTSRAMALCFGVLGVMVVAWRNGRCCSHDAQSPIQCR
jgi:hypothetical protein